MEKYIAYGFKRLLVYPGRQHIDFTPTPLPGLEWAELRRFGLSEGVVTVKIVCENMEAAAKKASKSACLLLSWITTTSVNYYQFIIDKFVNN